MNMKRMPLVLAVAGALLSAAAAAAIPPAPLRLDLAPQRIDRVAATAPLVGADG